MVFNTLVCMTFQSANFFLDAIPSLKLAPRKYLTHGFPLPVSVDTCLHKYHRLHPLRVNAALPSVVKYHTHGGMSPGRVCKPSALNCWSHHQCPPLKYCRASTHRSGSTLTRTFQLQHLQRPPQIWSTIERWEFMRHSPPSDILNNILTTT